ncbi:hypothetical protein GCM10010919_28700 [Alishewanella longhuensis]|uniref:DUF58 domain-containing protein n=1 Tax=Alishewanella longhuensis TaxID=1091037 RepID=A0ABQ3L277_9ALTE|nr:DUF58 domain-containing protein [Alishewanella longhuensis]GHG74882.1 hypothetical protein GCM10010919_28700 [Alishewanella longhuensis]
MTSNTFRRVLQQRFERWLDSRQPASNNVRLGQGVIYILPSRFGCWFIFLMLLLYLLGTNYQNNLILLTSFVFLSTMLYAMLSAFYNLHQLQITVSQDSATYAETPATLVLHLKKTESQMLQIGLKGQRLTQLVPLLQGEAQFDLLLPRLNRGCYPLPRLLLSSHYPLGLFRAWSYPALNAQIWVYPKPETTQTALGSVDQAAEHAHSSASPLDPDELKPYQQGDSPKRILWKKLPAAPNQPVVRQLSQPITNLPEWIVIPTLQGVALEQALSQACQTLITLEQQGAVYGLQTPLTKLNPATGQMHLTRCLQELALC